MSQAKKFKELINNTFEIAQTIDGIKTVYVSGDDTKLYVNKHFGNAYCYYDNTTDLKADFDHFNRLHVTDFIRLLKALQFEYNPCENFDKYSDITVTHSGTIGTTNNSTVTSKVNAFDSQSLVTDAENVANGGNTTTLNNSDGTIEHTHGNIGVQTVSNMILQSGTGEAYLRFNSFVEHYINRWISGCIVGYGDEENEIEFSPTPSGGDVTKEYVDEQDNILRESIETVSSTVTSHGESINALDSSLGGVIEDIEEIGGILEDHETRIERLENAPTPSSINYSLDEQLTGVSWIDDKPIYQKTFDLGNLPSDTTIKDISHGLSIDKLISISGMAYSSNTQYPVLYVTPDNINGAISVWVNNTNIRVRVGQDRSSYRAYVTLKYTKVLL